MLQYTCTVESLSVTSQWHTGAGSTVPVRMGCVSTEGLHHTHEHTVILELPYKLHMHVATCHQHNYVLKNEIPQDHS